MRDEFVSSSPANVAHTVFDAIVDEHLPIMNRLSALADGIEDKLLAAGDASDTVLDSLFHLKHELSALRRLAVPSRDIVGILMRPTVHLIPEVSRMYYDDVRDHLVRVIDMIDAMRDYLSGSLDIYTTQQTQRMNSDHLPAAHLHNRHLRDELLLHTGIQLALRLLRHPGAKHIPGRGDDRVPVA